MLSGLPQQPYTTILTKGKAYLYSAFLETSTQGAQVWITQGCPCKLHHTCLNLANVRQMAPPEWQTSDSSSLLIYRRRKDERLSWPSWLTYSGRYTHISGHTSATEARGSSPVRDRRSNHWATQQTRSTILLQYKLEGTQEYKPMPYCC